VALRNCKSKIVWQGETTLVKAIIWPDRDETFECWELNPVKKKWYPRLGMPGEANFDLDKAIAWAQERHNTRNDCEYMSNGQRKIKREKKPRRLWCWG
jgi:hypothetical protein